MEACSSMVQPSRACIIGASEQQRSRHPELCKRLPIQHVYALLACLLISPSLANHAGDMLITGPGILAVPCLMLGKQYSYTDAVRACANVKQLNGTGVLAPTSYMVKAVHALLILTPLQSSVVGAQYDAVSRLHPLLLATSLCLRCKATGSAYCCLGHHVSAFRMLPQQIPVSRRGAAGRMINTCHAGCVTCPYGSADPAAHHAMCP